MQVKQLSSNEGEVDHHHRLLLRCLAGAGPNISNHIRLLRAGIASLKVGGHFQH